MEVGSFYSEQLSSARHVPTRLLETQHDQLALDDLSCLAERDLVKILETLYLEISPKLLEILLEVLGYLLHLLVYLVV